MASFKVALFAEGSTGARGTIDYFERIWKQDLVASLGLRQIDAVHPISKKHLLAMDPRNPPMSGAGEPLDALIARKLKAEPFDAAVVAWDLFPAWAGISPSACRWNETVELYRLLGMSPNLPPQWREWAARKDADLQQRAIPGARASLPRIMRHAILAVCMVPDFEGLLTVSEPAVRRALGVQGARVAGWPTRWTDPSVRRPEIELLQPAIRAARSLRPPPRRLPKIRGDMRTAKHEWGSYFVRKLFADGASRADVASHPIARRLREVL